MSDAHADLDWEAANRDWMVAVLENAVRYLDTDQARAARPLLHMFAAALLNAGVLLPPAARDLDGSKENHE